MGLLGLKLRVNDIKILDRNISDQEESPAVKYVREIFCSYINSNIFKFSILNNDGIAICDHRSDPVPFLNVRNRVAIMTDSIVGYKHDVDQAGMIHIGFSTKKYKIQVFMPQGNKIINFHIAPDRA